MPASSSYLLTRYAIAVAAVAVAVGLRLLLDPLLGDQFPLATLFLAVLFAAWRGGFGPAVVAALLGGAVASWLLLPPRGSFWSAGFDSQSRLIPYLVVSLAIAVFGGAMRSARRRAEANAHQRQLAIDRHRRMEEQLSYLAQASATLTGSLEPSAVLTSVLELSRNVLPADAYAVWLRNATSGQWFIGAAAGLSDDYRQAAIGHLISGPPSIPEQPVIAEDVTRLPLLTERQELYRTEGVRSLLAVPLRIRGQVCGTLTLYHRTPHPFGDEEIRVATALANLAAAAIASADLYAEQTRLRAESQRAERVSRFLADASAALAGLVDYRSTLQKVARLAVPFFGDWCSIDVLEPDGSLKRLAVAHVDPAKVELAHELQRRYPPDPADTNNATWAILRTGEARMVPEITDEMLVQGTKDKEMLRILRELGLRSYLGVPLSARGKVFGVLTFIAAESGRHYEAGDLAVAQDLAHRAGVAIENTQLYEALRDADRRKDEFLAVLAHELRNPLAPVRNALQILKLAGIDAETAGRARDMAERQVQYLTRLVDDLLDVSRIMRGKIELRKERVALATLLERAVETARPVIDAARHELTVALPPTPVPLDVDVVRLAQVVANLLTNAAKYTEPGGRIRLAGEREGGEVVIRVSDSGIGIAPEVLPHIFELFMQAAPATRSQGGLGIGLTLVKTLVELHGGRVEAHSAGLGKGTEFVVRLPGVAAPDAAADAGTPLPAATTGAGRRVLVVDDNVDVANSLALLLQLEGHDVRVAHDGPKALALAAADRPDCIILDIGMPKMDGYEVARRLRRMPELAGVRLVAVTGWGQEEDRRRTRAAGFDHHFVKPVEPATLQQLLAALAP